MPKKLLDQLSQLVDEWKNVRRGFRLKANQRVLDHARTPVIGITGIPRSAGKLNGGFGKFHFNRLESCSFQQQISRISGLPPGLPTLSINVRSENYDTPPHVGTPL